MIRIYCNSGEGLSETDTSGPGTWTRITAPTDSELQIESGNLGIDLHMLAAATDADEVSRWEPYDDGVCMLVDIPYSREDGQFDTTPLAIILTATRVVTVCRFENPICDQFAGSTGKLDLNDRYGFAIRMLYIIAKTYQQDLREINNRRRAVEAKVDDGVENGDIIAVHKLENSLVYFSTSLRGCNIVVDLIRRNSEEKLSKQNKSILRSVGIENQQAIEMASIYREVMNSTSEMLSTIMGNKLNASIGWLTVITFIMSIPVIIAGIYGMNVDLPGQGSPLAFVFIMIGTVMACLGAGLWLKRKKLF